MKWFDYYYTHGKNGRLTCRYFGISPQTFYRCKRRYNPQKLKTLESLSCRPHHTRQPTWSPEMAAMVLKLREENPRWGKEKLAALLCDKGCKISVSIVGRILKRLKDRGVLVEPVLTPVSAGKRQRTPYWVHITGDIRNATFKVGDALIHDRGYLTVLDHPSVRAVAAKYPGRPGPELSRPISLP